MSTFAILKTAVESFAARSDFPLTVYSDATAIINRTLRVREMLSNFSATASAEAVSLPADFLEFEAVYVDRVPRVPLRATASFTADAFHNSSGLPVEYAVGNGSMYLNPVPDSSYSLAGRYYAKLADFSADADTNDVLVKFPEIYRLMALHFVFEWTQDAEREAAALAKAQAAIEAANVADRASRYAGPLAMRARASA